MLGLPYPSPTLQTNTILKTTNLPICSKTCWLQTNTWPNNKHMHFCHNIWYAGAIVFKLVINLQQICNDKKKSEEQTTKQLWRNKCHITEVPVGHQQLPANITNVKCTPNSFKSVMKKLNFLSEADCNYLHKVYS